MSNESIYCGQQLRRMRRMRDLTQLDLAVASGLTEKRIGDYERGGFPNNIAKKDIGAICEALQIEPSRLEKPLLENIYQLGLGVAEDLLLDPATESKQHVALLKYLESQRGLEPGGDDSEKKDLTQIFNIGVGNEE